MLNSAKKKVYLKKQTKGQKICELPLPYIFINFYENYNNPYLGRVCTSHNHFKK